MGRVKSVLVATVVVAVVAALIFVVYAVTKPVPPDQLIPEPLAFTVVEGTPIVRTCVPMTIGAQSLTVYDGADDLRGSERWSATGTVSLPAGAEFALGTPLAGFTATGDFPADLVSQLFLYSLDERDGRHLSALFVHHELAAGVWYDSLGDRMTSPCTHEPCDPQANCINDWPQPTGRETNPEPTFMSTPAP